MESYISKDAPEPGQLTVELISPTAGDLITTPQAATSGRDGDVSYNFGVGGVVLSGPEDQTVEPTGEILYSGPLGFTVDALFDKAEKSGLLFHNTPFVATLPEAKVDPLTVEKLREARAQLQSLDVWRSNPRRRVETAIRKTVCAILHIPSGEYVTKGFRGTTKDPLKIRFWDRKADARKVLSNWFHYNPEIEAVPADFEFIEREVFLPSTEVV